MRAISRAAVVCALSVLLAYPAQAQELAREDSTTEPATEVQYELDMVGYRCPARCGGRGARCPHCNRCHPYAAPVAPEAEGAEVLDEGAEAGLGAEAAAAPDQGMLASSFGAARGPLSAAPNVLGDFVPGGAFSGRLTLSDSPFGTGPSLPYGADDEERGEVAVPFAFRTFKIADNESPWLRDRVFYTANYFDGVADDTTITRQMMGFERVLAGGSASVGMRLPFFTVNPDVQVDPAFQNGSIGTFGTGTNTQFDIGDLSTIFKYSPIIDRRRGHVLTIGTAVTAPTGPDTLADADPLFTVDGVKHRGTIQPFMGFYCSLDGDWDGLFLHGFSSIDVPFDGDDATFWFNDIGLGYLLRTRCRTVRAIVPTLEAHVNTPLEDRVHNVTATPRLAELTTFGQFGSFDTILGQVEYHDQVNLTSGLTLLMNRSSLAFGVVTPVTGPNAFDYELQIQFNLLGGRFWPGR